MKKMVMVVLLCGLASAALAQEWTTTMDLSYTCKYIWRGFDRLDNAGAFQPSIDFLHESGFGANLWMSYPERGGSTSTVDSRVDLTEYNYTAYYSGVALAENCWQTNYRVGWRYFDFIDTDTQMNDFQEVFIEFAMPKLTGTPLTPHGAVYKLWPAHENNANAEAGTIYLLGFDYGWTFDEMPELPMVFSWDIVYNDGVLFDSVDHDWSHMVWGLKTQMQMGNAMLVPAVYFQNSFDDSVNNQDELWGSLSYLLTF